MAAYRYLTGLTLLLGTCTPVEALDGPQEALEASVPALAPAQAVDVVEPPPSRWTWPLAKDYGIRVDSGGKGWFGARRGTDRKHSGVDLSAPVGTPLLAICDGRYRTQNKEPYGLYVQLVCPVLNDQDIPAHASFLYAHLHDFHVKTSGYVHVKAGEVLGYVGKSGNASDPKIKAHLHLEVLIHDTEEAALHESHRLYAEPPKDLKAQSALSDWVEQCSPLHGLRGPSMNHKFDPILLLTCMVEDSPISRQDYTKYYE